MNRIYIVEDDDNIRELLIYTLQTQGMEAEGFALPSDFWKAMDKKLPNLLLLDIMLPQEDGLSILKKIRMNSRTKKLPVIMLTAKGSEYDTVLGLDSGADDYIPKPFRMMELLSRIRALLRRSQSEEETLEYKVDGDTVLGLDSGADDYIPKPFRMMELLSRIRALLRRSQSEEETLEYKVDGLTVRPSAHLVMVGEEEVVLTLKEFELLCLLLKNRGKVLTRAQLLDQIWGYEFDGESRTVDVHVRTLRQKLKEAGSLVETIRGIGYKIS